MHRKEIRLITHRIHIGLALAGLLAGIASAAEPFAQAGAKGTLTVDYVYEAAGKKQDKYDLREWRIRRSVTLVAELAAQKVSGWPQVQAPEAAQVAGNAQRAQQAAVVATDAAPAMASIEKIMARCGEDEACITRETQKLGFAMAGSPQLAAAQKTQKDVQALSQPGAPRYQAWLSTAEKGNYTLDEATHIVHADPICVSLPRARCTRDEVRRGSGAVPGGAAKGSSGGGFGAVELDAQKQTLTVRLPIPANAMPYTETITTDEPEGTHSVPTPKGPQARQWVFVPRVGKADLIPPITVPWRGGSRSQAGEQAWAVTGEGGEAGKLTVRWRFAAP